MARILMLMGPNLNMLGQREPEIYGTITLEGTRQLCESAAFALGHEIDFRQSNHEGVLVDWIQEAAGKNAPFAGVIINAAAYTHTSVAIHDALKLLNVPIIEVHFSDPEIREPFRHHSYIKPLAAAIIKGEGAEGHARAVRTLSTMIA
jgi:3-dehydroquinate dehydratase-2